jgi:hypothetical protein
MEVMDDLAYQYDVDRLGSDREGAGAGLEGWEALPRGKKGCGPNPLQSERDDANSSVATPNHNRCRQVACSRPNIEQRQFRSRGNRVEGTMQTASQRSPAAQPPVGEGDVPHVGFNERWVGFGIVQQLRTDVGDQRLRHRLFSSL